MNVRLTSFVFLFFHIKTKTNTERRDPEGKGDVWGLGLSIVSLIHGKEPLHSCSLRSQVEIEVGEAWKDGEYAAKGKSVF